MKINLAGGTRDLGRAYVDFEMQFRAGQSRNEQLDHMGTFADRTVANLQAIEGLDDEFNRRLADFYRGILSRCD